MRFGTSLDNSGRLKGNMAAKSRVVFGWLLLGASCALAGAPAPVTLANPMQGTDSGKLAVKEEERASSFRHETEEAQPSYYRVRLDTWKVRTNSLYTDGCAP